MKKKKKKAKEKVWKEKKKWKEKITGNDLSMLSPFWSKTSWHFLLKNQEQEITSFVFFYFLMDVTEG